MAVAQTVRLGYCNGDKIGTALRPQGEEGASNELSAAIKIPKETLAKYVGDTIYQISYANEQKVGQFMTVFIKTDLESRSGGIVQTVTDHKAGWNNVTLRLPILSRPTRTSTSATPPIPTPAKSTTLKSSAPNTIMAAHRA